MKNYKNYSPAISNFSKKFTKKQDIYYILLRPADIENEQASSKKSEVSNPFNCSFHMTSGRSKSTILHFLLQISETQGSLL